ncbi:competence type IV pilus minor pilin ComGG [Robertmurraya massiliosenegalensis]|uniref:competence type IV pilus minor pilin ComGG n=1 Tax=Robertmurraya massiliosenegalensis TaxID=1287657 RepID=UPI0002FAF02B|nr:competence type IV pilus minor pilin ComGG [Robertmurraya massiliosenegalensis]
MNDRGFTFPVTLCVLLLFTGFLAVHFHQYSIEKSFQFELAEFERNQFMFMQSLKKVENQLSNAEEVERTGIFYFENGTVTYQINELDNAQLQILFRLVTSSGAELEGFGYYDQHIEKMVKWLERN